MIDYGPKSKEFNAFRSDMLHLVNSMAVRILPDCPDLAPCPIKQAKETTRTTMTNDTLHWVRALLKDPQSESCYEAFRDVIDEIFDISEKLNLQRSFVECVGIEGLPKHYRSASKIMEAHSIHHRDLDDDENYLDGGRVLLVTQPLIVAVGKSDGSDYNKQRVLKKAVVWVQKPSHKPVTPVVEAAKQDQSSRIPQQTTVHIKQEQL